MKPKHWVMAVLFVVSAWLAFFAEKVPDTGLVKPVARNEVMQATAEHVTSASDIAPKIAPQEGSAPSSELQTGDTQILPLRSRTELLADSDAGQDGRPLFSSQSWTPPPKPVKVEPPPPPSAPPMPFVYIGKQQAAGHIQVYLARGNQIFIAQEKTVIDNTYRVEAIKPPTLSLVYLPLNQVQQVFIGATD